MKAVLFIFLLCVLGSLATANQLNIKKTQLANKWQQVHVPENVPQLSCVQCKRLIRAMETKQNCETECQNTVGKKPEDCTLLCTDLNRALKKSEYPCALLDLCSWDFYNVHDEEFEPLVIA